MSRPRAREFGIQFSGTPGAHNTITDVAGVEVGHVTLISGEAVRTGVTAVWPRGLQGLGPVFAGQFALNGNGEMTGAAWIAESGFLDGPVLLTNTHSVGTVRDSYIRWLVRTGRRPATNAGCPDGFWALPVVAETFDGYLNDINGFHIQYEHVALCLEAARSGPVTEGAVGAGTGTICYGFKSGIGTASRIVRDPGPFTLGVLVQANCGLRHQLMISGAPIGRELERQAGSSPDVRWETGSIIVVLSTDAPLLPHQANRLAKRAAMGLARTGSSAGNGSGDLFVAFSTASVSPGDDHAVLPVLMIRNESLDPLFEAAVEATEEAIINSLFAAEAMTGLEGRHVNALPLDEVRVLLERYGHWGGFPTRRT
jgi:L-aminopeptidase/D-esterase-like protein